MTDQSRPGAAGPAPDELRSRKTAFAIGCLANLIAFAVLVVACVVFVVATIRTLTHEPPNNTGTTPASGSDGSVPPADREAVEAVLAGQVRAWNRGDLDGFMEGYWRDDGLTFVSGDTVERGWEKTRARYVRRYKSEGKKMGRLSFAELEIDGLTRDTALVRGRYVLSLKSGMSTGRFTLVFRKFPDGWKITSDHTSAAEKPDEKK